jgi:heterodisulfide reductase subunit B
MAIIETSRMPIATVCTVCDNVATIVRYLNTETEEVREEVDCLACELAEEDDEYHNWNK